MSNLTLLLLIVEVTWVVGLSGWIILERRSPTATLAWIFALAWLPYVGIVLYLLIGPRRLHRKRRRYARARLNVAQASSELQALPPAALAALPADPGLAQFMTLARRTDHAPPLRADRLQLFFSGDDCYANIEEAIEAAEHHVHLEYYIWNPDRTGARFRDLLCRKARQGVHVRLLLDSIGSSATRRSFLRPLAAAGAEAAWFNPLLARRLRPGSINFRTHRKIVVCDGHVGFTGGMNVCDEHSAAASDKAAWRDTHVRIDGPPVGWLQRVFLEDWYFATGGGPTHAVYFPCDEAERNGPCVQIVSSGPDHDWYAIHKLYFTAISAARRRVLVSTPYFVPDDAILTALVTAALRGVDVRVLVPRKTDSRLVTAAAQSYYDELLRAGVQVYEYGPRMLHAKTLVADDIALVGTANMDNRSFRLNFEVLAAIYDAGTAAELAEAFAADLRFAQHYSARGAARVPFFRRLTQSTARLLSPVL